MKNLYFSFIVCLCTLNIFCQQSKVDSLKNRLLSGTEREKIEIYLNISEQPISRDSAIFYLNKALKKAAKINFDSIYPIQFGLCASYYVKGDLLSAKREVRKGFKSYKFTKDSTGTLSHINMLLGVFNEALNEVDSARYYYDKVLSDLKNKETKKSKEIISVTYTNYANLYLKSGNYERAIEIYLDAEKMSEKNGDRNNQLISLNNVAGCFKEIKNYDKALKYYREALTLANEINDVQNIGTINLGIGEIHMFKNEFDNALPHFVKAEKILKTIDFKSVLSITYQHLAVVYLNKKDIKKAQFYSKKAVKSINKITDDYSKVSVLLTSGLLYKTNNDYSKALKKIDEALNIAKHNKYLNLEKECLIEKIQVLKLQNNNDLLPPLYDKLLNVKDTILNKENLKSIADIETKYQTEKKERELAEQKVAIQEQELLTQKANIQKWLFFLFLIITILSLILYVKYAQSKKRQLLYNSRLNVIKAKQNEQEEIGIELHDNVAKKLESISIALAKEGNSALADKTTVIKNEIRKLSKELSIVSFEESTFQEQVITLASNYQNEDLGIVINGLNDIQWDAIDNPIKYNLFLIIREAISNSYNHSNATSILIDIEKEQKDISIKIQDNGKGFDENTVTYGRGFRNMNIRVKDINGIFKVKSQINKGTQIFIQMALA